METLKINYFKSNKEAQETILKTIELTDNAISLLQDAATSFYVCSPKPNLLNINKFIRHCQFSDYKELILDSSMLLHFSTGYTDFRTIKNILNNGLKCYESNISKYKHHYKDFNESNYVVDTWSFNSKIKYSDFALNSPKYNNMLELDRNDMEKAYAPASSIMLTKNYIRDMKEGLIFNYPSLTDEEKNELESRALQNIGFIIDYNDIPKEIKNNDIYSSRKLQKEFCGNTFLKMSSLKGAYSVFKKIDGRYEDIGRYGVTSMLYGIPGEFIVGIIATVGMLYSNEICKALFDNGMDKRFVISPTGELLYQPNAKLTKNENFEVFIRNKDEYLAANDIEYKNFIITKELVPYDLNPWYDRDQICLSNRDVVEILDKEIEKESEEFRNNLFETSENDHTEIFTQDVIRNNKSNSVDLNKIKEITESNASNM